MDRLRFLHIPKTAGSTFTTCLEYQYSGKGRFIFQGGTSFDIDRFNSLSKFERQNIVLFTGHAPIITNIEDADNAKIITFLRDPISRVKSFVQHISEGKSPQYLKKPFKLDDFLTSGITDLSNLQTKLLINKGNFGSPLLLKSISRAEARDTALNNVFNVIAEFGLQEYFDESLILFAKSLNWSTPFYSSINKKNTRRLIEFKQHHLDYIAELNSIDIEVYNAAKARFLSILETEKFDKAKLKRLRYVNSLASPQKYVWHTWFALYRLNRRLRSYFREISSY